MLTNNKHINNEPQLRKETQDIIARAEIQWPKSKEEVWIKMEEKLEEPAVKFVRLSVLNFMSKYAAVAALVLLIGFGATAAIYTKKIETGIAQQATFNLPDDSQVKLYANSSLTYKPLLWYISRSTHLEGEAFFKVKKGKRFEVISAKAKTVVLGTQFTVYARDNEYKVDCKTGKVKLIEATHLNEAIITAGQKAKLQANNQFKLTVQENKPTDIDTKIEEIKQMNKAEAATKETKHAAEVKQTILEPKEEQTPVAGENNLLPESNKQNQENIVEQAKTIVEERVNEKAARQEKAETQETNETKTEPENKAEKAKKQFRNSLSKKQTDILEDKGLDKNERRKAFMKSLSEEQLNLLREQNRVTNGAENNENNRHGVGQELKEGAKNQFKGRMKDGSANENGKNAGSGNGDMIPKGKQNKGN